MEDGLDLEGNMRRLFFVVFTLVFLLMFTPSTAQAQMQTSQGNDGKPVLRSLESLRDLDYQSWQVVAYRKDQSQMDVVLRIVGYPGKVRLDHPTFLEVNSGRRTWQLEDITILNTTLVSDTRQAAAEFDLNPLLNDLSNNRPLRLHLDGVFNELPIPPYLVAEWRTLIDDLSK